MMTRLDWIKPPLFSGHVISINECVYLHTTVFESNVYCSMQYARIPLQTYITIIVTHNILKHCLQIFGLYADGYSNFLHTSVCITHAKELTGKHNRKVTTEWNSVDCTARASNLTQDLHRKHCSLLRNSNAENP